MARAVEHVLLRQPVRRATEVCAAGEDDEDAVGFLDYPDAIRVEKLLVDAQLKVGWVSDVHDRIGFIQRPRKEEAEKHQEVGAQITQEEGLNYPATIFVESVRGWASLGSPRGLRF